MIRGIISGLSKGVGLVAVPGSYQIFKDFRQIARPLINQQNVNNFTSVVSTISRTAESPYKSALKSTRPLLLETKPAQIEQVRTVIKFSLKKAKRKSVKAVLTRFFRLHWGIWIRTRSGRQKKMYKKSVKQKIRLSTHVFCNATQSRMLDKMVTRFWRKPKYYIEDPYAIYHKRENFSITKTKPWRPEGVDYE